MKTLVAYYTKSGASRTYAEIIANTLKERGIEVTLVDMNQAKPDISNYELIIAGTGIRMFRIYSKWKKVLKHKEIGKKKLAIFLSSGTAIDKPDEAIEKWINPLVEKYKLKPLAIGSFPGKMPEKFQDEKDKGKETMKPEIAKQWAEELAEKFRS